VVIKQVSDVLKFSSRLIMFIFQELKRTERLEKCLWETQVPSLVITKSIRVHQLRPPDCHGLNEI